MNTPFASSVTLVVNKKPQDMGKVEAYLLEALVSEWRKAHNKASNESHRGDLRLEQYLENNEKGVLDVEDMSERLKNVTQYGMAEGMRKT